MTTGSSGPRTQRRTRVGDGPAGAERLVLGDQHELDTPFGAVAQLLEHLGPVGGGEDDPRHPGLSRARELVRHEGHASDGQHGLGATQRQRSQPGAEPADQQNSLHVVSVGDVDELEVKRPGARVLDT